MTTVSGQNTENKVRVSNNQARYYSELAEDYKNQAGSYATAASTSATLAANWAMKTDDTVDGEEYSAKYYAQQTQGIYNEAVSVITETTEASTTAIETLTADSISIISETTLALKTEAINTITTLKTEAVSTINVTASTAIETTTGICNSLVSAATSATDNIKTSVVSATTTATEAIKTSVIESTTIAVASVTSDAVGSVNSAKTTALNTISGAKTEALSTIGDLKTSAINTINTLTTEATTTINSLKTEAVNTITTLTTQATTTINSLKTSALTSMSTLVTQTQGYATNANIWAEGTDEQVQALGGTHSAKEWCLYNSTVNQNDVRALQGGLNQGEVYTQGDSDSINSRLSEIKSIAHSTFDRNKFTVVGSPTITKDGIAGGFSGVALTLNYNRLNLYNAETWEAEFGVCINDNSGTAYTSQCGINFTDSGYPAKGGICLGGDGKIRFFRNNTFAIQSPTFNIGDFVKAKLKYDNATGMYSMYISTNNEAYTFINSYTPTDEDKRLNMETSGNIQLMSKSTGGNPVLSTGSFDLKQFSITVDGVEVFSGNKTGIDTIKPDDYTAQGSMAGKITVDGIASGFTTSDYITIPKEILNSVGTNSWSIEIEGEWNNSGAFSPIFSGTSHAYNDTTAFFNIGHLNNQETWISYITLDDNGTKTATSIGYALVQKYGQKYSQKVWYDNAEKKYYSQLVFEDGTEYKKELQSNLYLAQQSNDLVLGYNYGDYKLSLNTLKIYISGVLKYQGCLKIPYTESKTGSKIVDSVYRDRVNDMAEQFGYANYYTLSDTDFTLPQVELYGLIQRQNFAPSDKYDSLTLGASGSTYVAPADGWFMLKKTAGIDNAYVIMANVTNGLEFVNFVPSSANVVRVFLPVKKNDVVIVNYNATGNTNYFRFIYTQGSESEAK